jgi:hypothetical protein
VIAVRDREQNGELIADALFVVDALLTSSRWRRGTGVRRSQPPRGHLTT